MSPKFKNIFMINFINNVKEVLPYNREQYINFLEEGSDSSVKWYGISFQSPIFYENKKNSLKQFVEIYEKLFTSVILNIDNHTFWIVNHDDKDLYWFPSDKKNYNLTLLKALFKERNIPNTFKGALTFQKSDLLKYAKDIMAYPYAAINKAGFLYKDLDVSHGEQQFIIKISGHLCIDFLSTNQDILREVVKENTFSSYLIKEYRGTSLETQ